MIVASLLLIPVAVLFLALGLVNGSSSLLITSIVVSLLAAVALVIGTRQAAARRAAEPPSAARVGRPDRQASFDPDPGFAEPDPGAAAPGAASAEPGPGFRDPDFSDPDLREPDLREPDLREPDLRESDLREPDLRESDLRESDLRESGPRGPGFRDLGFRDPGFDEPVSPAPRAYAADEPVAFAEDSASGRSAFAGESAHYEQPAEPDPVDVEAARKAGERDTAARLGDLGERAVPVGADYADSDSAADSHPGPAAATRGGEGSGEHAWRPAAAGSPDQTDEFDEPDDDDPDDEPLPQSVRPADAVMVARFDTEVLVVDGRPRYHMADCPHLVGRLTEPLPANEAVQLGFSPCGLCRPVDRLVAAVAHQR